MSNYPGAWGLEYEDVQGLCWLAYKGCGIKGLYQFSNGSQWEVTDVFEKGAALGHSRRWRIREPPAVPIARANAARFDPATIGAGEAV